MSTTRRAPRNQVTRQLSGPAKTRFLARIVDAAGAAPEVGILLDARIVQVLVTDSLPERGRASARPRRRVEPVPPIEATHEAAPPVEAVLAAPAPPTALVAQPQPASPAPRPTGKPAKGGKAGKPAKAVAPTAPATPPQSTPSPRAPFDPYGFSAMAVLMNEGRPALEALLAPVTAREQVMKLAEAQSVRIDPALLADKSIDVAALRSAFIEAVAQRIAHRRAISAG